MLYSRCNAAGFRLILGLALMVVTWFALSPAPPGPAVNDKLAHAATFLALAFIVDVAWPERRFGWRDGLTLAAYGGLLELAQYLVVARTPSLGDFAADTGGILGYALVLGPLLRRLSKPAELRQP
jgi:VanZ family protein